MGFARNKTSQFPNVSYQEISFEKFQSQSNNYDLIFSAQAWHWLNPKVAYKKAHDLLGENAFFALFWKTQEYDKLEFLKNLRELYIKHCPKYHDPMAVKSAEREIPKSKLFLPVQKKEYFVELEYDRQKYAQMVSTMSWVIDLSEEQKLKFNSELSALLEQQNETFLIPYKYTLLITSKKL